MKPNLSDSSTASELCAIASEPCEAIENEPCEAIAAGHICLDVFPSFEGGARPEEDGSLYTPGSALAAEGGCGAEQSCGAQSASGAARRISLFEDIFRPGKLTQTGRVHFSCGGAVANTGGALAVLGIRTALLGKTGDDSFGRVIESILRERGLAGHLRQAPGEPTSYTIVLAPPGIDRLFLHCPGTNDTFGAEDVDYGAVSKARLFHFGYPPLMKRLYAEGGRELIELFRRVKAISRAATSLDFALPDPASEAGRAPWREILQGVLPHVDFFLPSLEEMLFMLEPQRYAEARDALERAQRSGGKNSEFEDFLDPEDLARIAGTLLDYGAKAVIIKCGAKGLYSRTANAETLLLSPGLAALPHGILASWASRELWRATFHVPRVVSASGAGDCTIAGFLAAFLRGLSFERCLETACAVGACNVTAMDALGGLQSWDSTQALLREGWAPNPLDLAHWGWQPHGKAPPYGLWAGPRDASRMAPT